MDVRLGNDTRIPAPGLDVRRLVVGHSDEGFCFGIKDGIKRAGRNGKILVWQRIIAWFDPSRPSQQQYAEFIAETALFSPISLSAFGNGFRLPFGNSVLLSFSQSIQMEFRQR
jgi:hypothetical protein